MFVCCNCRLLSQHTNIFSVILQLKHAQKNALSECVNQIIFAGHWIPDNPAGYQIIPDIRYIPSFDDNIKLAPAMATMLTVDAAWSWAEVRITITADLSASSRRSFSVNQLMTSQVQASSTDRPSRIIDTSMARNSCISLAYWWCSTPWLVMSWPQFCLRPGWSLVEHPPCTEHSMSSDSQAWHSGIDLLGMTADRKVALQTHQICPWSSQAECCGWSYRQQLMSVIKCILSIALYRLSTMRSNAASVKISSRVNRLQWVVCPLCKHSRQPWAKSAFKVSTHYSRLWAINTGMIYCTVHRWLWSGVVFTQPMITSQFMGHAQTALCYNVFLQHKPWTSCSWLTVLSHCGNSTILEHRSPSLRMCHRPH